MIKTHTGEMIEPRVGDVVQTEKISWMTKLPKIIKVNTVLNTFGQRLINMYYPYDTCTLLHRPFQVGDVVKAFNDAPNHKGSEIIEHDENTVTLKNIFKVDGVRLPKRIFIHKNPAWRDHPDWKQHNKGEV